jgi:hypothetical protein
LILGGTSTTSPTNSINEFAMRAETEKAVAEIEQVLNQLRRHL